MQKIYKVNGVAAVAIVDAWLAKNNEFWWACTPDELKAKIMSECDVDGNIPELKAHAVLLWAHQRKMRGDANRGFGYFKQEWRKIRF
jgi:hypothetical protein